MSNEPTKSVDSETELHSDANQYLTFTLGDEEYGLDILKVQEIKGYVPTTRIPNSPPYMRGVLNLRGAIVPIVDLRRKFNLEDGEYDQFSAIVVVFVHGSVMGMIVDRVSEVISIPAGDIQPPENFSSGVDTSAIQGMAKVGDKLVILLDIETVLIGAGAEMAIAA